MSVNIREMQRGGLRIQRRGSICWRHARGLDANIWRSKWCTSLNGRTSEAQPRGEGRAAPEVVSEIPVSQPLTLEVLLRGRPNTETVRARECGRRQIVGHPRSSFHCPAINQARILRVGGV